MSDAAGGQRLAGETAVVTGSTSGLGREVARLLAREGARVVVTGRDRGRGQAVADQIRADGGEVHFHPADLADEADCGRLIAAAAERYGGLTVLVNNAVSPEAIAADSALDAMRAEVWQQMFEVNLLAPALLCRAAIPLMRAAGHGAIVNISSRAAERGSPRLAAYAATKAGLNALARAVTADHAREGVRCNTLQLGYVLNPERDAGGPPERMARYEAMSATRLSTPLDVSYAVVYLASAESGSLSGTVLRLDGGSSAVRGLTLG